MQGVDFGSWLKLSTIKRYSEDDQKTLVCTTAMVVFLDTVK